MPDSIYDIHKLEELFDNDPAIMSSLIQQFVADVRSINTNLRAAYAATDTEAQKHELHKLKGPVNNFGLAQASTMVTNLEHMLEAGDPGATYKLQLDKLQEQLHIAIALLSKRYN